MNQKHQNKRWNIFLLILSIFLFITIIDACRKADHETSKPDDPDNIVINVDKFFNVPVSAPTVLKAIASSMQKHNDTMKFADVLIKRAGYPRWDKAIVQTTKNKTGREQSGGDTTIVYLPFSFGTATSAVLTVAINVFSTKDTAYNIVYPQHYKVYGFDTTPARQSWNARHVFQMFTEFDHSIFGTDSFAVNDGRIGGHEAKDQFLVKRVSAGWGTGRSNSFSYTCHRYIFHPTVVERSMTIPVFTIEVCTAEYTGGGYNEGDPGPLAYPGTPIGGGGGGNNNPAGLNDLVNIPPCPNTERSAFVNPNPCDPAWLPLNGDPFADYENWGYHHFETWAVSPEDEAAVQDWGVNNIDTTGLNPCIRSVLNDLLGSGGLIGRLLTKIARASGRPTDLENFRLKFVTATMGADTLGRTKSGSIGGNVYRDTIVVNTKVADSATQVGVAQVLIHEIIHSYLNSVFKRYFNMANPSSISEDSIFKDYTDTLMALHTRLNLRNWVYNPLNAQFQHNYMADKLLQKMADALAYVDDNRNSDEFYWGEMWTGLGRSKTWKAHWPNFPNWPPTAGYPSPSNDSLRGLKYALTLARLDSISRFKEREIDDTAHAKGRRHQSTGCYGN